MAGVTDLDTFEGLTLDVKAEIIGRRSKGDVKFLEFMARRTSIDLEAFMVDGFSGFLQRKALPKWLSVIERIKSHVIISRRPNEGDTNMSAGCVDPSDFWKPLD